MKGKALAIILIATITIALSIGTWVIYNKTNELQYLVKNVKIAEVEWESGIMPLGGLTLMNRVNVTIQNSGANDVSGLILAVKMVYNGNELGYSTGFTKQIDTLHAGESLEVSDMVLSVVGNRPDGTDCVAILMWGNFTLDEHTKAIVWN